MTLKPHAPSAPQTPPAPPDPVSLLILGAGWTSTFLLPLLTANSITHAATTRSGSDTTIPFTFSPDSDDTAPYTLLPSATTILITFPLKGAAAAHHLVSLYTATHPTPAPDPSSSSSSSTNIKSRWILFGSTGIWAGDGWHDENSPYDTTSPRAQAEDALLALCSTTSSTSSSSSPSTTTTTTTPTANTSTSTSSSSSSSPSTTTTPTTTANNTNSTTSSNACILNLAGLYGGPTRQPRDWLARVATSKPQLRAKGCVHLIHGRDVARAVVLCLGGRWGRVAGRRWVLTDLRVYDWWGLGMEWGAYARGKALVLVGGEAAGAPGGDGAAVAAAHNHPAAQGEYMYEQWVRELMEEEGVRALPRDSARLGRKMDGRGFWRAVGDVPEVGRVE